MKYVQKENGLQTPDVYGWNPIIKLKQSSKWSVKQSSKTNKNQMSNNDFNKVDGDVFLKLNGCLDRDCSTDWVTGSFEFLVLYYWVPGDDSALISLFLSY